MSFSNFRAEPPPGFRGLDPSLPVSMYRRHLPHWRQVGATYFVTFRLADSIPIGRLAELKQLRQQFEAELGRPGLSREKENKLLHELARLTFTKTERWLDGGAGSCLLTAEGNRSRLKAALKYFQNERIQNGAYVIMPNHVHLIARPFDGFELENILGSIKRRSARDINTAIGRRGQLWQGENFDRVVRDIEHLWRCLQYIGRNPGKVGLRDGDYERWVSPEWGDAGWDFQDGEEQ